MNENQDADLAELNEARAGLCWWFSTMFNSELTKEQLSHYLNEQGHGCQLLNDLATEPVLMPAVAQIKNALSKLETHDHPELELAADYSQLFLADAKTGAPPYASVYLSESGLLFQKPHEDMVRLLADKDMAVGTKLNEPADHLAIMLDYLGNLFLKEKVSVTPQIQFVEQRLLTWIPQFVQLGNKVSNSGFYQGVCQLLLDWLTDDLTQLKAHVT